MCPIDEYFKGKGAKVKKAMAKEYGSKKGERIFYATANKQGMKPGETGTKELAKGKSK